MLRPLVVSEFLSTSFTYLLFSPLFSVSRSNGPLDTEKSEGLVYNQGAIIWQQQWPREECHSLTFPTYILHMSSSTFHEPRTPLCRCGGIKNLAFRQTVLKSFVRNGLRACGLKLMLSWWLPVLSGAPDEFLYGIYPEAPRRPLSCCVCAVWDPSPQECL